jgi:hypothetical protein
MANFVTDQQAQCNRYTCLLLCAWSPQAIRNVDCLMCSALHILSACRTLAELPTDSLHSYIISMTRTASDVLSVVLLMRECGMTDLLKGETQCTLISALCQLLVVACSVGDLLPLLYMTRCRCCPTV